MPSYLKLQNLHKCNFETFFILVAFTVIFIIIYDVSEIIDITGTAAANLPGIYKNEGSVFVMYAVHW